MTRSLALLLIGLMVAPVAVLLPFAGELSVPNVGGPLYGSVVQSFLSAFASLVVGLIGSLGLMALKGRTRTGIEWIAMSPSLLPTLLVIVASLALIQPFPFGLAGIVLLHAILNAGFVAVVLARRAEERFASPSLLAEIEGAGRWLFFRFAILRGMRGDMLFLFFSIFILCMSSFTIPFVASGGRWETLEVAIFEAMKVEGDIALSIRLAIVQSVLIFVMSWMLPKYHSKGGLRGQIQILPTRWALAFALFPAAICTAGMVLPLDWGRILEVLGTLKLSAIGGSLFLGLAVGLLCFFSIITFLPLRDSILRRFLLGGALPSVSITALGFLLLWPTTPRFELLRLPVVLLLFFLPTLYRSYLWGPDRELEKSVEDVAFLGAGKLRTLLWIDIPKLARPAGFISGLAAVWAMGDFAFSRFLMSEPVHLGMIVDLMVDRYRLSDGLIVMWLLLLLSVVVFFIFVGLGNVFSKKPLLRF